MLTRPPSIASSCQSLWESWVFALVLAISAPAAAVPAQFGTATNGSPLKTLAPPGIRAVALFFVASDCPISDRTFPEMKRLRETFSSRGVKIYFVYPNSTERRADINAHQHDYDPGGEILLDPNGDLLRLTNAHVTPEVSILIPDNAGWRSVYTGRVDDRYIHLGLERPSPAHIFAEEALNAVLFGSPVPKPTWTPVGCAIVNPATTGTASSR